ncbi:MAG: hypothetical protein RJB66_2604 [Pseudomonadota bacterium]|jgi:hypothetical protein
MSKCPYTWFVGLFSGSSPFPKTEATHLRVTVEKERVRVVDVALPAGSARWLIDLIPSDVIVKIKEEGIPIEAIQEDLAQRAHLSPQKIFNLEEPHRQVVVWLE